MRRWTRPAAALLTLALLATAFVRLGPWLVVDDPLAKATAVVVLNGELPRSREAARLYHEGWAPEIWLTQRPDVATDAPSALRGDLVDSGTRDSIRVLLALGVTRAAIHVLPGAIAGTRDELRLAAEELRRRGEQAVILVTSRAHTRRTRWLWWLTVGDAPVARVRGARETSTLTRWWESGEERWHVGHEVAGLLWAPVEAVGARLNGRRPPSGPRAAEPAGAAVGR